MLKVKWAGVRDKLLSGGEGLAEIAISEWQADRQSDRDAAVAAVSVPQYTSAVETTGDVIDKNHNVKEAVSGWVEYAPAVAASVGVLVALMTMYKLAVNNA